MNELPETLDLQQAATFLCMSPASLREKAKSGRIPGAKPGKRWVFLRKDLEAYLRSLYSGTGQAPLSGSDTEVLVCHSSNAATLGGSASRHPAAKEYADLLGLPTRNRPRNTTTG